MYVKVCAYTIAKSDRISMVECCYATPEQQTIDECLQKIVVKRASCMHHTSHFVLVSPHSLFPGHGLRMFPFSGPIQIGSVCFPQTATARRNAAAMRGTGILINAL